MEKDHEVCKGFTVMSHHSTKKSGLSDALIIHSAEYQLMRAVLMMWHYFSWSVLGSTTFCTQNFT